MEEGYADLSRRIERLHRLFLEVLKRELDLREIRDINNVQGLILYNIGSNQVSFGDITAMGYYLGSNVSYNLRKMIENKYIIQEASLHDARCSHVNLSPKGLAIHQQLSAIFSSHEEAFSQGGGSGQKMSEAYNTLGRIETFWSSLLVWEAGGGAVI